MVDMTWQYLATEIDQNSTHLGTHRAGKVEKPVHSAELGTQLTRREMKVNNRMLSLHLASLTLTTDFNHKPLHCHNEYLLQFSC